MTEPRARVVKNLGKANFNEKDLAMFLTAHGDSPTPLPETVKILDEIATEYIQGLSFEATRLAHHAARQKVKFEDFQFAMRRNPELLGKVQEMLDKKHELAEARKAFRTEDDVAAATDEAIAAGEAAGGGGGGGGGAGGGAPGGKKKGKGKRKGGGKEKATAAAGEDAGSSVAGGKRRKVG